MADTAPANPLMDRVVLRVGEKQFFTSRATLSTSGYFNVLWTLMPADQPEYFVDADPELFEHTLRYLRTQIFPLFYARDDGFDVVKYWALHNQAKLLQIDALASWIANEMYLNAVSVKTRLISTTAYGEEQLRTLQQKDWTSGDRVKSLSVKQTDARSAWKCPDGVIAHDGDSKACSRANCTFSRGNNYKAMRVFKVEALVETIEVNKEVLVAATTLEVPPPYITE